MQKHQVKKMYLVQVNKSNFVKPRGTLPGASSHGILMIPGPGKQSFLLVEAAIHTMASSC